MCSIWNRTILFIFIYYIYIAHLLFCRFSNVALQFSHLGHFPYCVIPLFLRVATPSQIKSLGSIQVCHLIPSNTSFSFGLSMQHSFPHSLMADRSMVFWWTTHVLLCAPDTQTWQHTCHPFYKLGSTLGPLLCWYDISHSRTLQVSITSLAATSVSQTVTHPSTNWAQSCLTSVSGLWMVTPCQWGSSLKKKLAVPRVCNSSHNYVLPY